MPNYLYGPRRICEGKDNYWCSVDICLTYGVDGDDEFKLSVSECAIF